MRGDAGEPTHVSHSSSPVSSMGSPESHSETSLQTSTASPEVYRPHTDACASYGGTGAALGYTAFAQSQLPMSPLLPPTTGPYAPLQPHWDYSQPFAPVQGQMIYGLPGVHPVAQAALPNIDPRIGVAYPAVSPMHAYTQPQAHIVQHPASMNVLPQRAAGPIRRGRGTASPQGPPTSSPMYLAARRSGPYDRIGHANLRGACHSYTTPKASNTANHARVDDFASLSMDTYAYGTASFGTQFMVQPFPAINTETSEARFACAAQVAAHSESIATYSHPSSSHAWPSAYSTGDDFITSSQLPIPAEGHWDPFNGDVHHVTDVTRLSYNYAGPSRSHGASSA